MSAAMSHNAGMSHSAAGLSGPERAAALLLVVGAEAGAALIQTLDDDEIRRVADVMARLGRIPAEAVMAIAREVEAALSGNLGLTGGPAAVRDLMTKALPEARSDPLLARLGPDGGDVWTRLSRLPAERIADWMAREHPQSAAMVIARLDEGLAARVLALGPSARAVEIMSRLMAYTPPNEAALAALEAALRDELVGRAGAGTSGPLPAARVAGILDALDRDANDRLMTAFAQADGPSAERVRAAMFTFADIADLDPAAAQAILRQASRDQLTLALKGATEGLKAFFVAGMSSRAARVFEDDLQSLGSVRVRDVDAARAVIVGVVKGMIARGEIAVRGPDGEDPTEYVS